MAANASYARITFEFQGQELLLHTLDGVIFAITGDLCAGFSPNLGRRSGIYAPLDISEETIPVLRREIAGKHGEDIIPLVDGKPSIREALQNWDPWGW